MEARRFDGVRDEALERWLGPYYDDFLPGPRKLRLHVSGGGKHIVSEGDWIVRTLSGGFIPIDAETFASTYQPARGAD